VKYLLDTNACVRYLRGGPSTDIGIRISQMASDDEVVTCSIVRSELLYGALRSRNPSQSLNDVDAFLAPLASFPFDDVAAEVHAEKRTELARHGTSIGPYDLMIAAIAILNGFTVVTHNFREFSSVSGLLYEDWQTTP
jgi:tRNA(fMet)-specific endonuclease VapC